MEKLARLMARKIGRGLNADDERIAVMAYGLTALLQLVFILAASVLMGCLFGFLPEAMIVFLSVGFLRRLIGGHHSQSFNGCLVMSILCIGIFSALAHYVLPLCGMTAAYIASGAVYAVASLLIFRLAPVDSPNKPVRRPDKIRRLRRSAFAVMLAFAALTVLGLLYGSRSALCLRCVWALNLSVLWQAWMLTRSGAYVIGIIDRCLK